MIHTRLLIAACVAAVLGAAPLIAQDMQQPGMNSQGGQSDQIYKKKKKMGQTQGQTQGQMTGTQNESQAAGQEMQPIKKKKLQQSTQGEQTSGQGQNQKKLKKPQQATGNQPMTGNEQATGGQAQPNKKKKLIQQGQAQPGQTKQGQPSEQMTTGATGKLATEIPPEKRTVVRQKLISTKVQRVERTKINIDLRVGVRVPRTIKFFPVPAEVISLVPAYRGFLYFVLADGTIVIVSPHTYEIVYVLTA